jgi:hypothetical protein
MIIKANPIKTLPVGTNVVIDSTAEALQTKGLLVAKTLRNTNAEGLPLRMINVTDQPQTIHKNTFAATPDQRNRVFDLLMQNKDVFSQSKYDIGLTHVIQHKINTGNAAAIKQAPRRIPLAQRKEVEDEINKMLDNNVIIPSQSPWASAIVVVRTKDNSIRLCIDYRTLNQVTVKDLYPLPRIDDSLDAVRGNSWFSTLYLVSGYYQCLVDPQDAPKTVFVTSRGLFHFNRMPFGLSCDGATFEGLMEYVLASLQWETCIIYLDDKSVFSRTFEEHVTRLQSVLSRMRDAGLKIAPKKCFLFQTKITFLGRVVTSEGILPDPSKLDAIETWPTPTNVKGVRSWMGTCSYYRRFIKDFSKIAKPLHRLTENNVILKWTQKCEDSFSILKHALTSSPILIYPYLEK